MRKSVYLILVLGFVILSCNEEETPSIAEPEVSSKQLKVWENAINQVIDIVYTYDDNGLLLKEEHFDDFKQGEPNYIYSFKYDNARLKTITISSNGEEIVVQNLSYPDNNTIIAIGTGKTGAGYPKQTFFFNDKNQLVEHHYGFTEDPYYEQAYTKRVFNYNETSDLINIKEYRLTNELSKEYIFTYSDKYTAFKNIKPQMAFLIWDPVYSFNHALIGGIIKTYNTEGELIDEESIQYENLEFDEDNFVTKQGASTYEYHE